MDQFLQFLINHWFLWSLLLVLIALLIIQERYMKSGSKTLSSQKVIDLLNRENALLVDIRDKTSFDDGHIISAMNQPLKNFDTGHKKLSKYKKKPVILVDVNGQHALRLCQRLTKEGFEKVYYLYGGIQEWRKASMPLVKND